MMGAGGTRGGMFGASIGIGVAKFVHDLLL